MLLAGEDRTLDDALNREMEQYAAELRYEEAARCRDRVRQLRKIKAGQFVAHLDGDVDVIALARDGQRFCIVLMTVRDGRHLGQRVQMDSAPPGTGPSEIVGAFISQHYLAHPPPAEIITDTRVGDRDLLEGALQDLARRRVRIKTAVRGRRDRWLEMAAVNAASSLQRYLEDRGRSRGQLEQLAASLGLEQLPERIECFDVSHTMGEKTVASCVVFEAEGPVRAEYRRYNIRAATGGDDYAAMREALERRYRRVASGEGRAPDLLLIDGGKGQLRQAVEVLAEAGLGDIAVVGVAKGLERRGGQERLFLSGSDAPTILDPASGASHLVQAIRDEAHRFAITGHRARRQKSRTVSALEEIPGIGPGKRRALLNHFGGLREVRRAGVDDLVQVPGINRKLAESIFRELHR